MNQLPMSKIGKHIISVTFGISVIEIRLLFDYWCLPCTILGAGLGAWCLPLSASFIQIIL